MDTDCLRERGRNPVSTTTSRAATDWPPT